MVESKMPAQKEIDLYHGHGRGGSPGITSESDPSQDIDERADEGRFSSKRKNQKPKNDPISAVSGMDKDFLESISCNTASDLLTTDTQGLIDDYQSWRIKNGLRKLKGNGAYTRVTAWKRVVQEAILEGDRSPVDRTGDLGPEGKDSEYAENETGTMQNDDDEVVPQPKRKRGRPRKNSKVFTPRKSKKGKTNKSEHILNSLPRDAVAFLRDINVMTAASFLTQPTGAMADKLIQWREENNKPKLAGTGATATLSAWKTKCRLAAEKAGGRELAEVKGNRLKRCKPAVDESENESEDESDICTVCGKYGNLMICDGCEMSFHKECLDPPLKEVPDGDWFCPECSEETEDEDVCMVCKEPGTLLICDGCEKSYHTKCLDPPLDDVPEEEWFCPACCSQKLTTSRSAHEEMDSNQHGSLEAPRSSILDNSKEEAPAEQAEASPQTDS